MKETFYKKVGRRYVPVSEYDSDLFHSMPKGAHLVTCYPGGSSTRYNINPNHAALIAASRVAEDAMSNALNKASELKPSRRPVTEKSAKPGRTCNGPLVMTCLHYTPKVLGVSLKQVSEHYKKKQTSY